MDKFSQLIIEAYRNQNFRFAEDPTDPEAVLPPAAPSTTELFAKFEALENDTKLGIYLNLSRAQKRLLDKYQINSELPINKDNTKDPPVYSDNSGAYKDEKIKTYYYRVMEYLLNNPSVSTSTSSTTETTTNPSSSSEELKLKRTKLLLSIETEGEPTKSYTVEQSLPIGQMPSEGGIQINDKGAATSQIYLLKDMFGTWRITPVLESVNLLNGTELGPGRTILKESDVISFSKTTIKINKIEDFSDDELSFPNPTDGGASSAGSASPESTSESVEPNPFAVDGPAAEISSNPSSSASPSNSKPKITLEVSGEEYQPPMVLKFDKDIDIGRNPTNDIVLKDPRVTRVQASIFLDNQQWFIKDNDSANGTFINGNNTRIKEPVQLKKDDQIRISVYYIKVRSIDTQETNEFGNPSNTSNGGFFGGGGSSTPSSGGFGGGRRR
jgi:pSer/pThr/pTyr-binding forkhead associated (FHA) protein